MLIDNACLYRGKIMNWSDSCLNKSTITKEIPVWEKFLLTVREASMYFNIGENKLHKIVNDYMDSDYKFIIQNGSRAMINRRKFEDFLNQTTSI